MSIKRKYLLVDGSHTARVDAERVRYNAGDVMELTPEEAARFGSRVQPYYEHTQSEAEAIAASIVLPNTGGNTETNDILTDLSHGEDSEDGEGDEEESTFNARDVIDNMSWSSVVKLVQESTDASNVSAILEAERVGKARQSVLDAATLRLKALELAKG